MGVNVTIKAKGGRDPFFLFKDFNDLLHKRLPWQLANDFKRQILVNIDTNRFKFQLNPAWQDYKTRIGGDPRPIILFGHYKRGIEVFKEEGKHIIGFRKSLMHPRAGMSMGKLAIMLEYGDADKGRPARPLWRRSAEEYFTQRNKDIRRVIIEVLENRIN